ncbi:MAG: type II toxin-antitoxin system VapC family toxin [Verrucomicrobiota bacterium]
MKSVYADSSFLLALHLNQVHTTQAQTTWDQLGKNPLPWAALHKLEVRNAIRRHHQRGHITHDRMVDTLRLLEVNRSQGLLVDYPVDWLVVLDRAELISGERTPEIGAGALDVLHVATALHLQFDAFVTFDATQAKLAEACGLEVLP